MSRLVYQTEAGEPVTVEFELSEGWLRLGEQVYPCDQRAVEIDGRRVPFAVHKSHDNIRVWLDGEVYSFAIHDPRRRSSAAGSGSAGSGDVTAQMPGKILSLAVKAGDTVAVGQNLLVMESMKMELALNAPIDGVVKTVSAEVGQMVSQGDLLVKLVAE